MDTTGEVSATLVGSGEQVDRELRKFSKERLKEEIVKTALSAHEFQNHATAAFKRLGLLVAEMQRRLGDKKWLPYVELKGKIPRGSIGNCSIIQPVVRTFLSGGIDRECWEKLSFTGCLKLRSHSEENISRLAPVVVEYSGLSKHHLASIVTDSDPMNSARKIVTTALSVEKETKIYKGTSSIFGLVAKAQRSEAAEIAQIRSLVSPLTEALYSRGEVAKWSQNRRRLVLEILTPILKVGEKLKNSGDSDVKKR